MDWISPIKDLTVEKIVSWFDSMVGIGPRAGTQHKGLDIAVPTGTPVYAPKAATVQSVSSQAAGGNMVILDHGDGFTSVYAHLERALVRQGERIQQGQQIATSGATGIVSGPHLHWEVLRNGDHIDPVDLFDPFEDVASSLYTNTVDAIVAWMEEVLKDDVAEGKTWEEWGGPLQANVEFTGAPLNRFGTRLYRVLDELGWRNKVIDPADFPTLAAALSDIELEDNDPLAAIGDAIGFVGEAFAFLLDPENWARLLALLAGAGLTFVGFRTMWEATNA